MEDNLLELAVEVARRAGQIILETPRQEVQQKADRSFVTRADLASQAYITGSLPGLIVAEEQDAPHLNVEKTWIVDPLDGTANYNVGLPGFAVNIAYMENGQLLLGAMFFPKQGLIIAAQRGKGCTMNGQVWQLRQDSFQPLKRLRLGLDIAHSVTIDTWTGTIQPLRQASAYPRNEPTSQSILDLLCGVTGVYYSNNQRIWDVAPGIIALEEVGGCVFRRDGSVVTYDRIEMGDMFYAATPALKEEVVAILQH